MRLDTRDESKLKLSEQQESANGRQDVCVQQRNCPLKPKPGLNGRPSKNGAMDVPGFECRIGAR